MWQWITKEQKPQGQVTSLKCVGNINLFAFPQNDLSVCFDFYNYSFSFTVELSLSRWWASEEQDCLINHHRSPLPTQGHIFDLSATSSYRVLLNPPFYLLFINFYELGNGLIKLARTLLKIRLGSETVSVVFFIEHWLPDLNTVFTFFQAFWIVEVTIIRNTLEFRQFESPV